MDVLIENSWINGVALEQSNLEMNKDHVLTEWGKYVSEK